MEDRMNMDGEGVRPRLRRQVDDLAGNRPARGVDKDVDPAEPFCRALDTTGSVRRTGYVAQLDRPPVRARCGHQRGRRLRRGAPVYHRLAAGFHPMLRDTLAYSPRTPCYDGELAGDFIHACFP